VPTRTIVAGARRFAPAVVLMVLAIGALAPGAGAEAQLLRARGSFSVHVFGGRYCPSPVDLCARGKFAGTLGGPYKEVVTALTPTAQPGILQGSATVVIHDAHGDLSLTEEFLLNTNPGSDGESSALLQVTGGTGRWANATGYLQAISNPPGTTPAGRYFGKIVRNR